MKFKLDENLPSEINGILKNAGYQTSTVLDQKMGGKADSHVISICQKEERALVTLDWDFADIRHYPPSKHMGIIVLKTSNQSKANLIKLAGTLLPILKAEPLKGQLLIVEISRIRIREG